MRLLAGGKLLDISDWDTVPVILGGQVVANIKREWLENKVVTFRVDRDVYTFKNGSLMLQSAYSAFVWTPQEVIGYYESNERYVPIYWEKIGV